LLNEGDVLCGEKRVDARGIELLAAAARDFGEGEVEALRRTVRARARHRVECVGDRTDAAVKGLAQVSAIIAERGANVIDVAHHRTFPDVLANCMQLDVTVELHRPHDLLDVLECLRAAGCKATLPDAGTIA
jgi:hypothetical protein